MNIQLRTRLDHFTDHLSNFEVGRVVLALIGTLIATAVTRRFIRILYINGAWFRSDGGVSIPLGNHLRLYRGSLLVWKPRGAEISALRRAWWFLHYKPAFDDIIIDVGSGRGEDTWVFAESVGSSGKVISIEAHPGTFNILKTFVEQNGLRNVEIHHLAAADAPGTCFISSADDNDWQCSSIIRKNSDGTPVSTKRLDDLPTIKSAIHVAFLKMNIEGAEVAALHGAEELLSKTAAVCVCCHDFLGEQTRTKREVIEILENSGFCLSSGPTDGPPYERDFVYGNR